MKCPFVKCPFCEYDLLLEAKKFSSKDKDLLPKTRYLQAYVKYSKIMKLAEAKEYKDRLGNSGRIRDLIKDSLNDMEMALELKFGKRRKNKSWEPWMHELADIRNHAIHRMTALRIVRGTDNDGYYLRALRPDGTEVETNEQVLPYLRETLEKIKGKLEITEI
jgi:hypothetical protein